MSDENGNGVAETPELWHVSGHKRMSIKSGDIHIASTYQTQLPLLDAQAHAARIVACVNALAGMEPSAVAGVVAAAREVNEEFANVEALRHLAVALASLDRAKEGAT